MGKPDGFKTMGRYKGYLLSYNPKREEWLGTMRTEVSADKLSSTKGPVAEHFSSSNTTRARSARDVKVEIDKMYRAMRAADNPFRDRKYD